MPEYILPVTESKVLDAMKRVLDNAAPGIDGICNVAMILPIRAVCTPVHRLLKRVLPCREEITKVCAGLETG